VQRIRHQRQVQAASAECSGIRFCEDSVAYEFVALRVLTVSAELKNMSTQIGMSSCHMLDDPHLRATTVNW